MKKAVLVARILLGFVFLFFGLNGILHFLPTPPMPPGDATTFATILMTHKYMSFVALCQVIGGLLLLVGRFVPLGLTILAPILVNILLFHFLLHPEGVVIGLVCTVLELFLLFAYRLSFRGLFDANPEKF
ncbi:DoxX family membrane protein [Granulicella arctica]|uniref:Putative membrane protein YphA (DoxX/SURF4 family) n=1 Tax=Granulicella arctica TaxID=940613 RepID=A0A7Y9TK27_9BACT|nr:DoxX family membrane protein [Granulicella arctica]NYF78867.1 putative membrane protein YphA (DoxX/SURF4 family) [Granulicella arctica]